MRPRISIIRSVRPSERMSAENCYLSSHLYVVAITVKFHLPDDMTDNKAGYTAQDAPSMHTFTFENNTGRTYGHTDGRTYGHTDGQTLI